MRAENRDAMLMRKVVPIIRPCRCVTVGIIRAKSAAQRKEHAPRIMPDQVPFASRTSGAGYQDARYGRGMRLHNPRFGGKAGKKDHIGFSCTVCGEPKPL